MTIESRVRKLEESVAARPVERVGPPVYEQVQALLADPGEVAAALEWDRRYLGADSPDRLALAGDEETISEAIAAALETTLRG